jgi:hypothetical protein
MKLQSPLLVGVILLAALVQTILNMPPKAESQLAAIERSASPEWKVELAVKPDTVAVGDLGITVAVRSARDGYLTLLQRGTDGKEDVVFPNALDKNDRIEADKPIVLPHKNWQWKAAPPAGEGRLLAVVSEKPVDAQSLPTSLNGQTYGAASAAYREHE